MSRTGNPLFDRGNPKDTGTHGRAAEKGAAARLRASLRPGSGALEGAKGDFTLGSFLIENKATLADSYSLKQETWAKIYHEALAISKQPALAIQFTNGSGRSDRATRLVCIPEWLFQELVGE